MNLTARARLTILFTVTVLAAGVALTALTYLLLRSKLGQRFVHVQVRTLDGAEPIPQIEDLPAEVARQVRDTALADLLTQAAVALAVVTVLAAAIGWLVSGRLLRPIRAISLTAQSLSAERLSERVPVSGPRDELTDLARTINGMLDRIQHGVAERGRMLESQKLFTANAAHELRTPLTTMRTAVDVTLDGSPERAELITMAEDIRTAIVRSQRTLDGLLSLAQSQAGPRERRLVDLAELVESILDSSEGVTVETRNDPAVVSGDPVLLERMVSNLVDNALRYNHPGGSVCVRTSMSDGQATLRVFNTGRVIPAAEAQGLMEPFNRGKTNRTQGLGLGLSIVRAIVVAHSGAIQTMARPKGGLDVTVTLPTFHGQPPRQLLKGMI